MSKIREVPLCFRKRPFGIASYEEFDMKDKGNLIDEETCHYMDISVKNLRYDNLTLFPGQVVKCVGSAKFSCQKISGGKAGETIQFNGRSYATWPRRSARIPSPATTSPRSSLTCPLPNPPNLRIR